MVVGKRGEEYRCSRGKLAKSCMYGYFNGTMQAISKWQMRHYLATTEYSLFSNAYMLSMYSHSFVVARYVVKRMRGMEDHLQFRREATTANISTSTDPSSQLHVNDFAMISTSTL